MTSTTTTALVVLGTLGVLLYASSKNANGAPKGPSPEPSPAPPQDADPTRQAGYLCCPAGEILIGSVCKKYDGQGNYVYSGPAKICVDRTQGTISRLAGIFGMNGGQKTNAELFAVRW